MPGAVQEMVRNYHISSELESARSLFSDSSFIRKQSDSFGREVEAYWKKHLGVKINPAWHSIFASFTGKEDVRFVAKSEWFSHIHDHLNQPIFYYPTFGDKNFLDLIYDKSNFPKTVFKRIRGNYYNENNHPIAKRDAFQRYTADEKDKVAKPSMSSRGDRILLVQVCNWKLYVNNKAYDADELSQYLGDNFIVQYRVEQHPEMAKVHPASLNTLRIYTLRLHREIHHLGTIIKFGANGKINDNHSGGIFCKVFSDGSISTTAHTRKLEEIVQHPDTRFAFSELNKIPSYNESIHLCCTLHEGMPHLDFAAWDVAVNRNSKPIIIEANSKPSIWLTQFIMKEPLFGSLTEGVLHTIKKKIRNN